MINSHNKTNDFEISGVEELFNLLSLPKSSQDAENDLKKAHDRSNTIRDEDIESIERIMKVLKTKNKKKLN
jgi:hypothetical protein